MVLVSDIPLWIVLLTAFVFGALWGSFFNVAIFRWPRGISVVSPRSFCPHCGESIASFRNIPIFGWVLLRGRAACCRKPISPRYPLIETLSALLCLGIAEKIFGRASAFDSAWACALETCAYFAFAGGLVVATFIDLERLEIPDEVSLPGAALGLATAPLREEPGAESAALGAGGAYLLIQLLFVWTYERFTGRRGMGEGDAKLLLMIGAFLGWRGAIFALVAGAAQGLIVAAIALAAGRRAALAPSEDIDPEGLELSAQGQGNDGSPTTDVPTGQLKMPFGPFLALSALEFFFLGDRLWEFYEDSFL